MVSNGTLEDFSICTTVFENPHCGKSLVPLMNASTLCDVTTLSKVVFNSGVRAAAASMQG